jgi:hypothetical protein
MSRIRLVPVIFILVISLAILFAGWQAYRRFNLVNPLKSELQQVTGVKSVQIETGNPSVIDIQLNPVKDLQTTYIEISHVVAGTLGGQVDVNLLDNKDDELTSAMEDDQLILNDGLAKGNYIEMVASAEQKAAKQNIDARITMDEHNIYVQLTKGNHYLYKVEKYTMHQGGASS